MPGSVDLKDCGAFSGDYAPIIVRGADGKYYMSIFDKSGTLLYDPIPADIINEKFYFATDSYHGYTFAMDDDDNYLVITPQGETRICGIDDLSEMGQEAQLSCYYGEFLSDGFFLFTLYNTRAGSSKDLLGNSQVKYISIDGKKVIDSIKVSN